MGSPPVLYHSRKNHDMWVQGRHRKCPWCMGGSKIKEAEVKQDVVLSVCDTVQ
jgi:hypothetical protein